MDGGGRRGRPKRGLLEPLERRDLLAVAVGPVAATEDRLFHGPVATFSASDLSGATPTGATIDWGEGTTTAGTISGSAQSGYTVSGTKTYTRYGVFPVTVTASGGRGASAVGQGTATVEDAPLTITGTSF